MYYYTRFRFENFKLIPQLELELRKNEIVCIVGLNESGKTTVLKAIETFSKIISSSNIITPNFITEAIPRDKSDNFNTNITFAAELKNDNNETLTINVYAGFKFSELDKLDITVNDTKVYCKSTKWIRDNKYKDQLNELPDILYYNNFLGQVPDKIDISIAPNDQWSNIFFDILRVTYPKELSGQSNDAIYDWLFQADPKILDARIDKMSSIINECITKEWATLNNSKLKEEIVIKHELRNGQKDKKLSIQFEYKQSNERFMINERSTGCRWFFGFLLFTKFRTTRKDNTLFLLDEPASSLHLAAQEKIKDALDNISQSASIIYTTHSPYLLDHKYFRNMYVLTKTDDDNSSNQFSMIKYFQYEQNGEIRYTAASPILRYIEYKLPTIHLQNNSLIVEGKSDWFLLQLFIKVNNLHIDFIIVPCDGVNSVVTNVHYALAYGYEFQVLLDADKAGKRVQDKLHKEFPYLCKDRVSTLANIINCTVLEDIISHEDKEKLKRLIDNHSNSSEKSLICQALEFALLKAIDGGEMFQFTDQTKNNLEKIINHYKTIFDIKAK